MIEPVTLHTLNARGNAMLEVARDYFGLSAQRMNREIQAMLRQTISLLSSKAIKYADLRAALVPQPDRREIALVIDSTQVPSDNYAMPAHERLLRIMHRGSSRSILAGDFLGSNAHQEHLRALLKESLVQVMPFEFGHSNQFYIIYVNNLTDTMFAEIATAFAITPASVGYVGFVDTTYASGFKWWLTTCLPQAYIQHRNVVIGPHEDDRSDSDDVNLVGFPFEKTGYKVRSVPSWMEGVFLTYKIERPILAGGEVDTEFSLNAVHPNPQSLTDFEIVVDERKFDYLEREKGNSMRGLGLLGRNSAELQRMIRDRINSSYIYNMAYSAEHDVARFNVILEVDRSERSRFRTLAGLKYLPERRELHLITLF